jgi:hypothetical protein
VVVSLAKSLPKRRSRAHGCFSKRYSSGFWWTALGIRATFNLTALLDSSVPQEPTPVELSIPASTSNYGHEPRLRLDPADGSITARDQRLVELVARAFVVRDQLVQMTSDEAAAMPATTLRHLERVARLAYLEPGIVSAILKGTQPRALSARELSRMAPLPLDWSEQRQALGFAA